MLTKKTINLSCYLLSLTITVTAQQKTDTISYIQSLDITTGKIDTLLKAQRHYEAPNWHPSGYLIMNSYGKLYTLDIATKKVAVLNTGTAIECNNDQCQLNVLHQMRRVKVAHRSKFKKLIRPGPGSRSNNSQGWN